MGAMRPSSAGKMNERCRFVHSLCVVFAVVIACSVDDAAPGDDAAADVATCAICSVRHYICGYDMMHMESFDLLTSDRRPDACKVQLHAGLAADWSITCEPPQLCDPGGACFPLTVMSRSFKWTRQIWGRWRAVPIPKAGCHCATCRLATAMQA